MPRHSSHISRSKVQISGSEALFASAHRFTFNGQERTDEIAGTGNHNTALYWEYDTRLGRRWNVDPVDQVNISNYAVNGLNPILYSDPNGDLFGIKGFGSTSEQRKAAREYAKQQNGTVNNLLKKSINVTYNKTVNLPITHEKTDVDFSCGIDLIEKIQYFNIDGSLYDDKPTLRAQEPTLVDNWRDNYSFTYGIANTIYTAPQLFTQPFSGGWYNLDGTEQNRGSSELLGNFVLGASSFVPVGAAKYAMGPMKQWIRVGPSFSKIGGFETIAMRWGAGGNFWKKIPSKTLQEFNKKLRETRLPISNWRTVDPGHFHLWKK
jgi:hypothetical protein